MKNSEKTFESVLNNPCAAYQQPKEVITDSHFDRDQKIKILKQWETDARELQVATEEGMGGGEHAMLKRVQDALRLLQEED